MDGEEARDRRWAMNDEPIALPGTPISCRRTPAWHQAVSGEQVLNEIAERFEYYLFLPHGAADAMALWAAHTFCYRQFQITPRLNICSPTKRCGKSNTKDILSKYV